MDQSTPAPLGEIQKEDDYLGPIWEKVEKREYPFPKFFIKEGILHRKSMPKNSESEKHLICMPDRMLRLVLHNIHERQSHGSVTQTLRQFQCVLYHKNAKRMMISCIEDCAHCALSRREKAHKAPVDPRPKGPRNKKGKKSEQRNLNMFQAPSDVATAAEGTVNTTAVDTAAKGIVNSTSVVTAAKGTVNTTAADTAAKGTVNATAASTAAKGTVNAPFVDTAAEGTMNATAADTAA